MIFGKDDFVRTRPYGRSRICLKARKYRRFGGVRIILVWHAFNQEITIVPDVCSLFILKLTFRLLSVVFVTTMV